MNNQTHLGVRPLQPKPSVNSNHSLQGITRIATVLRCVPFVGCFALTLLMVGRSAQSAQSSKPPPEWVKQYGESAVWVDTNAPWPEAAEKGLWPETQTEKSTPAPQESPVAQPMTGTNALVDLGSAPPDIKDVKVTKHEVGASVDFLIGQGNTTIPLGASLGQVLPSGSASIVPTVLTPDRNSSYLGATLSYSYGQAWYLDLAYANGNSSGTVDLEEIAPTQQGEFEIGDDWFQAYVRYAFPQLRGKRLSAYLRVGATFIQSDMTLVTTLPQLGVYQQDNQTDEIQGNLGFGVLYSLFTTRRARLGLQFEGEGFFGSRSQESIEKLLKPAGNIPWTPAEFDTVVYGGLGRATLRFEYGLGKSGLFRLFGDGGVAMRYSVVDYSDIGESPGELLWGPYVKVGARYSF